MLSCSPSNIIFIFAPTVLADSLEESLEKANKYTVKILNSIDIPFIEESAFEYMQLSGEVMRTFFAIFPDLFGT